MLRSTFSTTTMASSTTMPMASTRPNSDSALIEKPNASITAKVPMSETGTASSGMIDARQVCRKRITTSTTSSDRFEQRVDDGLDRVAHEHGRVVDDAGSRGPRGNSSSAPPSSRARWTIAMAFEPGAWKIGIADRGLVVEQRAQRVFRAPSSMRATSRRRVTAPSAPVLTMMLPNSSSSAGGPGR